MSAMTAPELDAWASQERILTVDDMADMPDDEFRYELDDGVLIVSPAPSNLHQRAVTRLAVLLSTACPRGLEVFAGVGVNINRFQHRVPDVVVASAEDSDALFQESPPLLVVEVASPRTRLYDRNRKKDVYESFAIPAYWIVDPDRDKPTLTVFELRDGKYDQVAVVTGADAFEATIPFPVRVVSAELITLP